MRWVGGLVLLLVLGGCTRAAEPAPAVESDVPPVTPSSTAPVPRAVERWDPRDVDGLPAAGPRVAAGLPAVVDTPHEAPRLAELPIDVAVLAVERRDETLLMAPDGRWRSVPGGPGVLSPDGTRLLVTQSDGSARIWELAAGTWTTEPRPRRALGWDFEGWRWLGDGTLFYDDRGGGWIVHGDAHERVDHPRPMGGWWTSDTAGAIVESAEHPEPAVLTDHATGRARRVSLAPTGRLESLVVDADTVVGTSYDGDPGFRLVAARRTDLTPEAVLRLGDHEGNYSNWGLRPFALLDDGTVLVRVAVPSRRPQVDGWRVVAWRPATGDLSLVTRSDASPVQRVSFAVDLLEARP